MLGKLMKYEMYAIWHKLGVLYVGWLAIGVLMGVMLSGSKVGLSGGLAILAFVVVTCVACVMTFMVLVGRFKDNLLGDEGYFMLTLPVSTHKHIWSKTISASLWLFFSLVVAMITLIFMVAVSNSKVSFDPSQLNQFLWGRIAVLAVEIILFLFITFGKGVLKFYASIVIGKQVQRHQGLCMVVTYIGLTVIEVLCLSLLDRSGMNARVGMFDGRIYLGDPGYWMSVASIALLGAFYYAITYRLMKNRLNLGA